MSLDHWMNEPAPMRAGKEKDFMLFARLTPRGKQSFVALLLPHMPVLHAKALYWTRSRRRADQLLDAFLRRMAVAVEDMRRVENLRLWLVKSMYEDFLAQQERPRETLLDKEALLAAFCSRPVGRKSLGSSPFG